MTRTEKKDRVVKQVTSHTSLLYTLLSIYPMKNVKRSQPQSHCHLMPNTAQRDSYVQAGTIWFLWASITTTCVQGGTQYTWYTGQVHTQVTGTGVGSGTVHCSKGTLLVRKCILHPTAQLNLTKLLCTKLLCSNMLEDHSYLMENMIICKMSTVICLIHF